MGGCWTWLSTLLSLFWNFYSFCISEENESDIWNKIALINESNDGKWLPVSNQLCQALSKSTQDYGLLFLPPRMPQVLSRSPAPMPQQWTKQPKPTSCYEGKHVMKVHLTKLSAAVSFMWTLTQMTQIIVFRFAQWKGIRSLRNIIPYS